MKPKIYLASGWFNPEQKKQMNEVYEVLKEFEEKEEIEFFSPFYDGIVLEKSDPNLRKKMKIVWWVDIEQLKSSDLIIVCTQDHDVGTIFEAGYGSAKRKELLCYNSKEELGLNVMLAQEAKGFCKNKEQLTDAIDEFIDYCNNLDDENDGPWVYNIWKGEPI